MKRMPFATAVFALTFTVLHPCPAPAQLKGPAGLRTNFEDQAVGEAVKEWFLPNIGNSNWTAIISAENPFEGKHCAVLSPKEGKSSNFGNILRGMEANPYRNQRLKFRAAVRVEGADTRAQLWFRVDRKNEKMGFFENMSEHPITSSKWATYRIVGDIAPDAEGLVVGCMVFGTGKVYLDDISLTVEGKAGEGNEPARELSERGLQNLTAFTKLLGYVRFFHPSDESAATHWPSFALRGVQEVEKAKDAAELAQILTKLFEPIAPTVRVFVSGQKPAVPKELTPANAAELRIVSWRHFGVALAKQSNLYTSQRMDHTRIAMKERSLLSKPHEPFEAELGGGVACMVPLALYTEKNQTLPIKTNSAPTANGKPEGFVPNGNDRATRLSDIALSWTVFQHFYPYFKFVKTDWPAELEKGLKSAATDSNSEAFLATLQRMVAALHDGHGGVYTQAGGSKGRLPLLVDWVEDQIVVTDVGPKGMLKPGDIVLEIDGKHAAKKIAELETRISGATPQWIRHRALADFVTGPASTSAALKIRSGAEEKTVALVFAVENWQMKPKLPEKIAELKPGIYYVDLDRVNDADFQSAIPKLEKATGIIYDLRGYPSKIGTDPIAHITDKTVRSAQWQIPVFFKPDQKDMTFEQSGWPVVPKTPKFSAKIAFITGGGAISYAETYMGIIDHFKLAAIVGGTTAGTNGNINPFSIPGGYTLYWTGMQVRKQDGSQHHGVGIKPTHPVSRTTRGIAAGKDELLEKAVTVVGG